MGQATGERDNLRKILREQLRLHACMDVQDVCKLLYQASFGCEHMMDDIEAAERALRWELSHPPPFEGEERLVEEIDPSGAICRVNLRPYRAIGGKAETLISALERSVLRSHGGEERFKRWWRMFGELVRAGTLPFSATEVERFEVERLRSSLSVISHSQAYRDANRPCYRVILVETIPLLGLTDWANP